ncbi:efflux RND transporter periplasmic adaptor subunit [Rhizobium sp. NRK18]|uniref:efflux RND transporter periplasmic adaptor subunit n=1 Tax=Rhizobium sp. NRK18 TaxID=2964667 RepID=UPI0021C48789|nr:efflux RND transporter periplasmic adaptor subunit [Rhizobium sp. NRK18]MCQ2004138.1 efflux RND transporter periplasmic adaptor subunit [Rhizobium sp. NRK18]
MKTSHFIFAGLGLLAVIGGGYWVNSRYFGAETPRYIAADVHKGTISQTVLATGIIKPKQLVAVGAQVSGRITSVKVAPGDDVKKGDLIAEIDSATQENNLKTSQAQLDYAKAQRNEKAADLRSAELTLARQQSIYTQKAGSQADLETAQANLEAAKAQVAAIDAQIVESQVAVDTAKVNIGYTRISAPIDGTVLAVVNQEGRTVNASQSAPTIVILGDLSTMTVRAEISEADIVNVEPGQKVYFNILGEPDQEHEATLASIEPAPESITSDSAVTTSSSSSSSSSSSTSAVYYIGVFDIDNKDRKFRTYMTAEVKVVLAEAKDVLVIPSSALGTAGKDGKYSVQVVGKDGTLERRQIETGLNNKTLVEVKSGLTEGERVVIGEGTGASGSSSTRRGPPGPMGL